MRSRRMLPNPTLSLTLPSLHDDTGLDCRLYHPDALINGCARDHDDHNASPPPWSRNAAVVAHPYAPMGGCYDDPVVDVVAGTLRHLGFVVATFNFRGASSSGGRTSWTSKPERADYMSVVGFLACYVHHLNPPFIADNSPSTASSSAPSSPTPSMEKSAAAAATAAFPSMRLDTNLPGPSAGPVMLLAGYSYGAMVTLKLPALDQVLSHFTTPTINTAAADIRLRAQHLAEQQNDLFQQPPTSPRRSLGVRVGGDEHLYESPTKNGLARRSHSRHRSDSHDPEEIIKRGVKELVARSHLTRRTHLHQLDYEAIEHEEHCLEPLAHMPAFRPAYLAVSPPFGIVTNLATLSFSNPLASWSRRRTRAASLQQQPSAPPPTPVDGYAVSEFSDEDAKLVANPAMAIYGDSDSFLTLRKMRDWSARLQAQPGSLFRSLEIASAGHFWAEPGVIYDLRDSIALFATGLVS